MSQITKKAMASSLKKLLETKTLSKITVGDITDDCEINRHTFYYHFQDIYMLLECLLQQETKKVQDSLGDDLTWQEYFEIGLAFAVHNKTAVYHLYQSMNRETLEYYLGQVIENILRKYIDIHYSEACISEERKNFIIKFYKYGMTGICLEWIAQEMTDQEVQRHYIQDIEKSFQRSLGASLRK